MESTEVNDQIPIAYAEKMESRKNLSVIAAQISKWNLEWEMYQSGKTKERPVNMTEFLNGLSKEYQVIKK